MNREGRRGGEAHPGERAQEMEKRDGTQFKLQTAKSIRSPAEREAGEGVLF